MKILIVSEDPRRVDWVRASVGGDAIFLSASNGLDALRVVGEEGVRYAVVSARLHAGDQARCEID